mmetsp:Transcript_18626/g.26262  ORF Transcript_18626/g.26262 Transcript_18626/m.26262 type:complete len:179 (+) Transcript_18626:108-644(+)
MNSDSILPIENRIFQKFLGDMISVIKKSISMPIRLIIRSYNRYSESNDVEDEPIVEEAIESQNEISVPGSLPELEYLWGCVYTCCICRAHISSSDTVISKEYTGRYGRALLVEKCVNIKSGESQRRMLLTGVHIVADISCIFCDTILGWRYYKAFEPSQRFKEGKFIIETGKLLLGKA